MVISILQMQIQMEQVSAPCTPIRHVNICRGQWVFMRSIIIHDPMQAKVTVYMSRIAGEIAANRI
jgi:hypothetical protein